MDPAELALDLVAAQDTLCTEGVKARHHERVGDPLHL